MHILIATGQPFIPQMHGGLQSSGDTLAQQLRARGHTVHVLSALMPEGYLGMKSRLMMKLSGARASSDPLHGYTVWRSWFPWAALPEVAARVKPDVAIILARQPVRMALEAMQQDIPVVMMLQDVEFHDHGGPFGLLGEVPCVANSHFTARAYETAFGVCPRVIFPLMDAEKYRTSSSRTNITFINPHPYKGLDIALAVARACPHIPFAFVEAWPLTSDQRRELNVSLADLPNVTLQSPVDDMREVYRHSKLVLAPSRWSEAFGRVGCEPQFSGIPVIASTCGGLPEAVGSGGILIDPLGPIEHWIEAVERLWSDDAAYEELSAAARAHVLSPALSLPCQMDAWEEVIAQAVAKGAASGDAREALAALIGNSHAA